MLQQHKKYKGKDKDKEEVEEGEWDLDEDREEEWEEVVLKVGEAELKAEAAWVDPKVGAAWEDMVVAELVHKVEVELDLKEGVQVKEEVLAKEGALVGKEEVEGHKQDSSSQIQPTQHWHSKD